MASRFAGLLTGAAVVVTGVIVGTLAVVYHAALQPLGMVAVIGMIVAFGSGLRLVGETRWLAALGLLALFSVVVALAGSDNQGSVLVMADATGLAFLGLGALVATITLAWPKFSARTTSYDRKVHIPERTLPQ